jgi:hypothetical protein
MKCARSVGRIGVSLSAFDLRRTWDVSKEVLVEIISHFGTVYVVHQPEV